MATTGESSITVPLSTITSPTYVIKSSYSVFTGAESGGVEVKVDYKGMEASDAKITLNGDKEITLAVGERYYDKGITVMLDGENITSQCTITPSIPISDITKTAGYYALKYNVMFAGMDISDESVFRSITVQ